MEVFCKGPRNLYRSFRRLTLSTLVGLKRSAPDIGAQRMVKLGGGVDRVRPPRDRKCTLPSNGQETEMEEHIDRLPGRVPLQDPDQRFSAERQPKGVNKQQNGMAVVPGK